MSAAPWREATDDEVRSYYANEFQEFIPEMPWYLEPNTPKQIAVSFGDNEFYPTQTRDGTKDKEFIRRESVMNGETVFPTWQSLVNFLVSPAGYDPLRDYASSGYLADPSLVAEQDDYTTPVSRAVYHHVQSVDDDWLLVFDIDAKDISLNDAQQKLREGEELPEEVALRRAGHIQSPPDGYKYTFEHVEKAIEIGFELENCLQRRFNFEFTQVVYSGQGVHIYGLDHGTEYNYDHQSRRTIVYYMAEQQGYPIDKCVTKDVNRVIRMPYSLHADVGRIVTPLASPNFDPRTDAVPTFLTNGVYNE
jgi:hypothetical protein